MGEYTSFTLDRPRDGVVTMTLNRPDRLNAFNYAMIEEIHAYLDELLDDLSTRILVLTGAGRAFCAGTDLKDGRTGQGDGSPPSVGRQSHRQRRIADVIHRMRAIPQPIVAAVNGVAAGGGFSMAMASDIRIAAQSAKFIASFINVGISSGDLGSSYFLPRLVGLSRAAEILYTGREVLADEAERIGLVSRVVPDGQALEAALETVDVMLAKSPFGLMMTKEVVNASIEAASLEAHLRMENRTQTLAVQTGDLKRAAEAFREKRPPDFSSID